MRKQFRGVLVVLLLLACGCKTDPYTTAIKASDDVSQAVSKAIPLVAQYYSTGKLTDSEKALVGGYLQTVTVANQTFRHNAVAAHTAGQTTIASYLTLAQAFVNAVPTDPTAFQYKSADAQAQFKTVLGAVKIAIDGVALLIQNSKGA